MQLLLKVFSFTFPNPGSVQEINDLIRNKANPWSFVSLGIAASNPWINSPVCEVSNVGFLFGSKL